MYSGVNLTAKAEEANIYNEHIYLRQGGIASANIVMCAKLNQNFSSYTLISKTNDIQGLGNAYKYVGPDVAELNTVSFDFTSPDYEKILNTEAMKNEDAFLANINKYSGSQWWFGDVDFPFAAHIEGYIDLFSPNTIILIEKEDDSIVFIEALADDIPYEFKLTGTSEIINIWTQSNLPAKISVKFFSKGSTKLIMKYDQFAKSVVPFNSVKSPFAFEITQSTDIYKLSIDLYPENPFCVCSNFSYIIPIIGFQNSSLQMSCSSDLECNLRDNRLTGLNEVTFNTTTVSAEDSYHEISLRINDYDYLCKKQFDFRLYEIVANDNEDITKVDSTNQRWF